MRRENLQRNVTVTARLEGVDLGAGVAAAQRAVADLHLPAAIRVAYGGAYEEQQRSFKDLLLVLVLAVVLVFIVLLFEFGDFAAPMAVVASALLSTVGVFLALLVTRTTFNLSSFMGLIMVIGIVAKNGILLLDADQRFRAEGMSPEESMIQAGERRLRPILMTALATVAGMIPLALGLGAGSQMLQPLAIAVIGGILASMVLSLVITPAVHYFLADAKCKATDDASNDSPCSFFFLTARFRVGVLCGSGLVRRLQRDEPRCERLATVLVEVDHRVVFVDFDERARPVGGLTRRDRPSTSSSSCLYGNRTGATSAARDARRRHRRRPDCRRSHRPPPNPPSGLGRASFTVSARPPIWNWFSSLAAFCASSSVDISTNANPRARPVAASRMTRTDSTVPALLNSSCNSASPVV